MHYAVHGHTAAELIYERADADKPHMGLTVSAYLDLAEDRAERHVPMDLFLMADDREILQNAGKITAEIAKAKAETSDIMQIFFSPNRIPRTRIGGIGVETSEYERLILRCCAEA